MWRDIDRTVTDGFPEQKYKIMTEVVACPICNESVTLSCVNRHIDSGCKVGKKHDGKLDAPNIEQHANGISPRQDAKITESTRSDDSISTDKVSLKRKFGSLGSYKSNTEQSSISATGKTPPVASNLLSGTAPRSSSISSNNRPPTQSPTAANTSEKAKIDDQRRNLSRPLADRARPTSLEDYVGQEDLLGNSGNMQQEGCSEGVLRGYLESGTCPSFIFWGPPGVGKTTLARIIAKESNSRFVELSATSHGTADCKRIFEEAKKSRQWTGSRNTILFLDEVHRFNRAQQDIFLPYVERGDITLIGATTENPSFKINSALLSRCRVFVLKSLGKDQLRKVISRALDNCFPALDKIPGCKLKSSDSENNGSGGCSKVRDLLSEDCIEYIASVADGDARTCLNMLEMAANLGIQRYRGYLRKAEWISNNKRVDSSPNEINIVTETDVRNSLKRTTFVYDQSGDAHYDTISAFHKAVRGSDANAALYYLARMLQSGEDPLYVARRMVRIASEDIGVADESCLPLATAAYLAAERLGMPECDVVLAQAAVKLALARKSVAIYRAWNLVKSAVKEEGNSQAPIPLHIRNAPTKLMSDLGYSEGYKYNPDYKDGQVKQEYLPLSVKDKYPGGFLDLSRHLGDRTDSDLIER